jgi:hypothetical protein
MRDAICVWENARARHGPAEGGGEMFSEGELPLRERGSGIYLCREQNRGQQTSKEQGQ